MGKNVLLLEDQANTRRGIAALLEFAGHDVQVARNALEAQALCAEHEPDVAIVDIGLPGLQGNEWALHLREVSPATRIIFVSGQPGMAGLDLYGPDVHFLHKPFEPEELLALVLEEGVLPEA